MFILASEKFLVTHSSEFLVTYSEEFLISHFKECLVTHSMEFLVTNTGNFSFPIVENNPKKKLTKFGEINGNFQKKVFLPQFLGNFLGTIPKIFSREIPHFCYLGNCLLDMVLRPEVKTFVLKLAFQY